MTAPVAPGSVIAAFVALAAVGTLGAQTPAPIPPVVTDAAAIAAAHADSASRPYTKADVDFMSGMIHHHAQAVLMAGWAPSHGASEAVETLCARIANAQRDEIRWMQQWLLDRRLATPVPVFTDTSMALVLTVAGDTTTADAGRGATMSGMSGMAGMAMGGAGPGDQQMLMPGMLTQAQLDTLRATHGPDFDRVFLRDMIQHHTGALTMVHDLFESTGGAQDETVFKLASDINVDQTTEIARMRKLLVEATLGIQTP